MTHNCRYDECPSDDNTVCVSTVDLVTVWGGDLRRRQFSRFWIWSVLIELEDAECLDLATLQICRPDLNIRLM